MNKKGRVRIEGVEGEELREQRWSMQWRIRYMKGDTFQVYIFK